MHLYEKIYMYTKVNKYRISETVLKIRTIEYAMYWKSSSSACNY